jgi:hypothetical protein
MLGRGIAFDGAYGLDVNEGRELGPTFCAVDLFDRVTDLDSWVERSQGDRIKTCMKSIA